MMKTTFPAILIGGDEIGERANAVSLEADTLPDGDVTISVEKSAMPRWPLKDAAGAMFFMPVAK